MQFALSRIMKGTPCSLRQAATARPDGPAPTITGPFTHMQRLEKSSSGSKVWIIGGIFRLMLCILFQFCDEVERLEGEIFVKFFSLLMVLRES